MAIEKCKNCIHWEQIGELEKGLCDEFSIDNLKPKPKDTIAHIDVFSDDLYDHAWSEFNTHESFFCRLFEINKKNFE